MNARRRVLVTGASGFVGAHLTRHLVGLGDEVHALCRPTSDLGRLADVRDAISVVEADLRDGAAVAAAVTATRPDRVFHLAAATMHGGRSPSRDDQIDTNLRGTIALMDACVDLPLDAFVNLGNAFEYGSSDGPVAEAACCRPAVFEGVVELAATSYANVLAAASALPVVTVRPFSIVGPADDARRLVPRLVDAAARGTPVALSDPAVVRDFLWVDDLVGLCLLVADRATERAGTIVNGGSGVATSLGELVATVQRVTDRAIDARWGTFPTATHDVHHPIADPTAAHALGWRAAMSLPRAIHALWSSGVASQVGDEGSTRSTSRV